MKDSRVGRRVVVGVEGTLFQGTSPNHNPFWCRDLLTGTKGRSGTVKGKYGSDDPSSVV